MTKRVGYLIAIILLASPASILAQQGGTRSAAEVVTLDQAISLALSENRQVKNAQLGIGKAEDQLAATQTSRLPKFEFNALAGQQLVSPDFTFTKGVLGNYANVGPIPDRDVKMSTPSRPTAILFGQVTQPLSQLHRIRLNIKQAALLTEIS